MLWKLNRESWCFIIGWKRALESLHSRCIFLSILRWRSLISQVMSVVICFSSHYIIVYLSTWTPSYLPACSLCFRFFFLACFVLEWKTAEGGEIIKRELLTFKLRYLIELISFLLIADVTMFYVCYCRRVSNDKCDMKYNSIHEE